MVHLLLLAKGFSRRDPINSASQRLNLSCTLLCWVRAGVLGPVWIQSQLSLLLGLRLWNNYLSSLCFSLLICKTKKIIVLTSCGCCCCENPVNSCTVRAFRTGRSHGWLAIMWLAVAVISMRWLDPRKWILARWPCVLVRLVGLSQTTCSSIPTSLLVAQRLWPSYVTILCLGFLACRSVLMVVPTSQGSYGDIKVTVKN